MGKGDKKTRRGKISLGSHGVLRPRDKKVSKKIESPKPKVEKITKEKSAEAVKPKAKKTVKSKTAKS